MMINEGLMITKEIRSKISNVTTELDEWIWYMNNALMCVVPKCVSEHSLSDDA